MSDLAVALRAVLASGDAVQIRIRERGAGDVYDFLPRAPSSAALPFAAADLLAALEQMAARGDVSRSEAVHPFDGSEYVVTWRSKGGRMTVYTIGYGNRKTAELIAILEQHGVRTVVDVRLRPDRAHSGDWTRGKTVDKGIAKRFDDAGIMYVSRVELGNLFLDYPDWKGRYGRLLDRAGDELVAGLEAMTEPYCLFCAELDPTACHRTLIAAYLAKTRGVVVCHL